MKMQTAMAIIEKQDKGGFMVNFERRERGGWINDHFPDKYAGETLIQTEEEAWELAVQFAKATKDNLDIKEIYVINENFYPVKGYADKILKPRIVTR
jgi:hypothetical protein